MAPPILQSVSTSEIWGKAIKQVQSSDPWKGFCSALKLDPLQAATDVDTPGKLAKLVADVQECASKAQATLPAGRKTIALREVFEKVTSSLLAIKDFGTAAATFNPYASLAWSGVLFFIQAAHNSYEIRRECWENLPKMIDLVVKYQTFENVYSLSDLTLSKDVIEGALLKLYVSILQFQVAVVNYSKSRRQQIKATFQPIEKSIPRKILNEIQNNEAEVARLQTLADRELIELENKDIRQALERLHDHVSSDMASLCQHISRKRREAILKWISPIKYENAHNRDEKTAMVDTGGWLISSERYESWQGSPVPSTFWLYGFMGSGKSCLTHVVIEDMKKHVNVDEKRMLAYFYCDGTSVESAAEIADSTMVLRCLLKQLCEPVDPSSLSTSLIQAYDELHLKADLPRQRCLQLIIELVSNYSDTTIILDGLDECPAEVQRSLGDSLFQISEHAAGLVRIFISSRRTPEIEDILLRFNATQVNVAHHNRRDIAHLVKEEVSKAATTPGLRKLYVRDEVSQEQAVVQKLLEGAQGMFRWVRMSLDYLNRSRNFGELGRRLDQLSRANGLFDVYDLIYDEMMRDREEDDQDLQAIITLLTYLMYGQQLDRKFGVYLFHQDVLHLVSFAVTRKLGGNGSYSADELVALCPSLLSLESRRYTYPPVSLFALPHFSVREYLAIRHSDRFSPARAHANLAHLCIEVFRRSNVDEIIRFVSGKKFVKYCVSGWLCHLQIFRDECGGSSSSDLLSVLDQHEPLKASVTAFLLDAGVPDGFKTWVKVAKTPGFQAQVPVCWFATETPSTMVARVFLNLRWDDATLLSHVARPGTASALYRMTSILHFSCLVRNIAAVHHFVSRGGVNIDVRDEDGRNALYWAYQSPYYESNPYFPRTSTTVQDVVTALIDGGIDVNARDRHGETPLFWIPGRLLSSPSFVTSLLTAGADPAAVNRAGETWLTGRLDHGSDAPGFLAVLQLLLPSRRTPSPSSLKKLLGVILARRESNELKWSPASITAVVHRLLELGLDGDENVNTLIQLAPYMEGSESMSDRFWKMRRETNSLNVERRMK